MRKQEMLSNFEATFGKNNNVLPAVKIWIFFLIFYFFVCGKNHKKENLARERKPSYMQGKKKKKN